jgi:site-specific recombinase XerD
VHRASAFQNNNKNNKKAANNKKGLAQVFVALLEDYVLSLKASNRSPKTITWYIEILKRYLTFLSSNGLLKPVHELGRQELRAYITHLQKATRWQKCRYVKDERKLSPFSIQGHARCIKAFWGWLFKEEYIDRNPLDHFPLPSVPDTPFAVLSIEQIQTLLSCIDRSSPAGMRHLVIILLLFDTGCRISELLNIKLDDIDFKQGSIIVLGKGKRYRPVFFIQETKKELLRYINRERTLLCEVDSPYLFPAADGSAISINSVQQFLRRLALKAKLNGTRCSPHVFRHSFATHSVAGTAGPFELKELMGHRSLNTTMKYIHLSPEDLQRHHERFSPAKRLFTRKSPEVNRHEASKSAIKKQ